MKQMKITKKRVVSLLLIAVMLLGMLLTTGCGGDSKSTHVKFWIYGDTAEQEVYTAMTEEFNRTFGAENGIQVDISVKPASGYSTAIQTGTIAKNCPDVFLVDEDNFKKWIGMDIITNMDEYLKVAAEKLDYSDAYKTTIERLRYNKENNTSDLDDPLYGLPLDTKPTAIYYNATMFKKAGIVVISVDEEDLEAFNAGTLADNYGKTLDDYKKEYPQLNNLTGDIPAKGYFRSLFPYTGAAWRMPSEDEILIFNNRISMNWDEIEDLAMLFSPSHNEDATKNFGTEYGFFTEWWFNYGWSVGGDCLEDLSGNGDWNFSLLDDSSNYMVMTTYTGTYTGKTYTAGETLDFLDKFDIPAGVIMEPDEEGGYTYNGQKVGVNPSVSAAVANGALYELPSTRTAFIRYLALGADESASLETSSGLNISPNPNTFATRTRMNYFYSQKMAMLVDYSNYMSVVDEQAKIQGFEWDVAPLPLYKEYKSANPYDGECLVKGKLAGQSNSKAMVSCNNSEKKQEAAYFMAWMASEAGQKVRADMGYFPNQESLAGNVETLEFAKGKNIEVFFEGLSYQTAGDWWYMPDYAWINVWAIDLNSSVRNNKMSYMEWKKAAIPVTNEKLKEY